MRILLLKFCLFFKLFRKPIKFNLHFWPYLLVIITWPTFAQIPFNNAIQISAGSTHNCALTNAGSVECWGENMVGQLGDGSIGTRTVAVNTLGLSRNVLSIATRANHGCAVLTGGNVKCWGSNYQRQLGSGTTANTSTQPLDVLSLTDVTSLALGAFHSCALTSVGSVKCWGDNNYGQLGDGSRTQRPIPVQVSGLTQGVVAISVGYIHTCALLDTGNVKCWGANANGQLGDNTRVDKLQPTTVLSLDSVSSISAGGEHTCANSNGEIKCWGSNNNGQLGNPPITRSLVPIAVANLPEGVSEIASGGLHTCALINNGQVFCWGDNYSGELGDGTNVTRWSPVIVSQVSDAAKISASSNTCIITTSGSVKCWGNNYYGQLGMGSTSARETIAVQSLQAFAPRVGLATPGNTQAIVRFQPPTNDSGSPVTGYMVTSLPPDGVDAYMGTTLSHTGPDELSHLVTGLRNGISYKFRVTATNALGTSLFSTDSNTIIPSATASSFSSLISSIGSSENSSSSLTSSSALSSEQSSSTFPSSSSVASSQQSSLSLPSSSSVASSPQSSSSLSSASSAASSFSSIGSVNACNLVTPISWGITSSGSLAAGDCTSGYRSTNYYTDRYSFTASAGQQVAIQLSGSFDTYVFLKNPAGTAIDSNDDGGGGTNSRIPASSGYFTIPAAGTYQIEVTSYSTFATGAYSLTVTTNSAVSTSSASSSSSANPCSLMPEIVRGITTNGALTTVDCSAGVRGSSYYADRYSFTGVAGQRISLLLTSSAFDTFVYLYFQTPSGAPISSDDDGGGGSNSRIPHTSGFITLPSTGTYVIEVSSYSSLRIGAYSLLLTQQP